MNLKEKAVMVLSSLSRWLIIPMFVLMIGDDICDEEDDRMEVLEQVGGEEKRAFDR